MNFDPWDAVPPVPSALRMPVGFVVPIEIVPRPHVVKDCEVLGEDDDAAYTTEYGIFLWEGLTPRQRWHRLTHESVHAFVDWMRWVEIKTKRA